MRCVRRLATSLTLGILAAVACGVAPDLAPVPVPNLDNRDPGVRAHLEGLADRLAGAGKDATAWSEVGRAYHAYGLHDAALVCYGNARTLAPDEPRFAYWAGLIHAEEGRIAEAARELAAAATLAPDHAAVRLRLADALFRLDRTDEAAGHFRAVVDVPGAEAAALHGLGRVAAAHGDPARAAALFERALVSDPDAVPVHYALGTAYRELGRLPEAREHLAHRGRGSVRFPDPWYDEVGTFAEPTDAALRAAASAVLRGDEPRALAAYREVLERDPDHGDARLGLGQLLVWAGRHAEAAEHLRRLLVLDPGNVPARYQLALAAEGAGDDEGAIEHYRAALALDPGLGAARGRLARALARKGRLAEALAELDAVLARDPHDETALADRPVLLLAQGRRAAAVEAMEAAAAAAPRRGDWRLRFGQALAGIDPDAAREHVEAALAADLDPDNRAVAHHTLASLALAAGDLEVAAAELDRAVALRPTDPDLVRDAANVRGRRGEYDRAAELFATLSRLAPGDAGAALSEATALVLAARFGEALDRLGAGRGRHPGDSSLTLALAKLRAGAPEARHRDGKEALALAREVEMTAKSPESAEVVAMALAETGDFAGAAAWQERALSRLPEGTPDRVAGELRTRLAGYREGIPYRFVRKISGPDLSNPR